MQPLLTKEKYILYSFNLCNLGWLLSAPIPVADEALIEAIGREFHLGVVLRIPPELQGRQLRPVCFWHVETSESMGIILLQPILPRIPIEYNKKQQAGQPISIYFALIVFLLSSYKIISILHPMIKINKNWSQILKKIKI